MMNNKKLLPFLFLTLSMNAEEKPSKDRRAIFDRAIKEGNLPRKLNKYFCKAVERDDHHTIMTFVERDPTVFTQVRLYAIEKGKSPKLIEKLALGEDLVSLRCRKHKAEDRMLKCIGYGFLAAGVGLGCAFGLGGTILAFGLANYLSAQAGNQSDPR